MRRDRITDQHEPLLKRAKELAPLHPDGGYVESDLRQTLVSLLKEQGASDLEAIRLARLLISRACRDPLWGRGPNRP
jgi:hypothetical protein